MANITIEIPGFNIACQTWGDKSLPALVSLHGWLDNSNSFAPLAPFLSNYFNIIAIDLPGHGMSSHIPTGCHYHFIDGIFKIFSIIDALGHQCINLLGHSMGACLASLIAGVAPSRVDKLFLIEGLGPFSAPDHTCQEQLARYLNHHHSSAQTTVRPYKTIEEAAKARAKRGHISVELAKILCERSLIMKEGNYYWCHDRRLLTPTPLYLTEDQILSCLGNIASSTTLIWADEGFDYDQTIMTNRLSTVPNLQQYKLAGGHHIHMEKPKAIAEVILNN